MGILFFFNFFFKIANPKKLRFSKPPIFNQYGHEVVRCKLKNSLKTQKIHFLPVFELALDIGLGTIHKVRQHFFSDF
jgi:hypothetical protein